MSFTDALPAWTMEKKDDLLDEIIDRFGEPPEEVEVLWRVACLRALCRLLHIRGISVKPGELRITFAENAAIDPNALMQLISEQQQYEFQKRRAGPAYFPHSQIKN